MKFFKKWKKNLAEVNTKLEKSLKPTQAGNEMTTDDLDLTELMPKFIENMRPRKESELYRTDMEMLEEQLNKGGRNPFCTYSRYNEFFGIKMENANIPEEMSEDEAPQDILM